MPDSPQGIIESLLHPPINVLSVHLDTSGPYSGNNTIYALGGGRDVDAYFGLYVRTVTIPPGLGLLDGYVDDVGEVDMAEYIDRLWQVVVQGTLFGGAIVANQVVDGHTADGLIVFEHLLPAKIGLYVLPFVEVDLYGLLLL